MTLPSWTTLVVSVGLLWSCSLSKIQVNRGNGKGSGNTKDTLTKDQFKIGMKAYLVPDNFYGSIECPEPQRNGQNHPCGQFGENGSLLMFLQGNKTRQDKFRKEWPQVCNETRRVYIPKYLVWRSVTFVVLFGNCTHFTNTTSCSSSVDDCCSREVKAKDECEEAKYDETACEKEDIQFNNMFVMEVENRGPCLSCDAPVKEPDEKMQVNSSLEIEGETLPASEAANLMKNMNDLVGNMKGSSAELSLGAGVSGILVKEPDEAEGISFAYSSPTESMKIIDNKKHLDKFSRWISVSKQAFEKATDLNVTTPFAAVLRFVNMSKDEYNNSVLWDEVVAIEMGAMIRNLTDTLNITFKTPRNEKMIPHCHSWDGEGDKPNWTDFGCLTVEEECCVTCQCTHMTFFAILMTPINETISSYDLKTLTIISQVGCGLSMFFLSIILLMHFLLRRTKASQSTIIFIHLVASLFLLDFTFLVNNHVANLKSSVGCKIMAAGMHYSMLATFSWFSAQALHLCLQMYKGGNILIKRYVLKVSLASWSLPGVTVIVLLILGKYGEQTINTEDSQYNVDMCWINDNDIHYIVNIGYYMIVFLFTFSTAIIILWWLFNLKRIKKDSKQEGQNGKCMVAMLGLCLQLGITWAFAFFAYGDFRIPATYIFTVLNSFQGFFLFIYYHKTSHSDLIDSKASSGSNTSQSSTCSLKTKVDTSKNPYK